MSSTRLPHSTPAAMLACALVLAWIPFVAAESAAADSATDSATADSTSGGIPPADRPTNVPDPYGLGERLALIDDLHNRGVAVPDNADLRQLRTLYRDRLDTSRKTVDDRHDELVRRLWVDFHQTAPDHASDDDLAALLAAADKRQQAADQAERERQHADDQAAADQPAAPARPAPATAGDPPALRQRVPATPDDGGPAIGAPFPAFSGTTVTGRALNLSDVQGKGHVVLVDFWATWCGPCVGEMPNVIATYAKYHDQGFEIIGVSLDQDKDALTAFIDQHGIGWQILFDGNGWNNAVARQFAIHSIPNTWLIGKDGRLIAHGLRGEALGAAVAQALAQP